MKSAGLSGDKRDIYKLIFDHQSDEVKFVVDKIKDLIGTEIIDTDGKKRGITYYDIAVFIWDYEAKEGYMPDLTSIYERAKELFITPPKNHFIKTFEGLKEEIKSKRRLSLQGLYAEMLSQLGLQYESLHENRNEIMLYNLGRISDRGLRNLVLKGLIIMRFLSLSLPMPLKWRQLSLRTTIIFLRMQKD